MDKLLRQDFLKRTVDALCSLIEATHGETENFSENFRREAFRALHTIKGTAQTIGFPASGKLAHELENLLAAASLQTKNSGSLSNDENHKTLLVEGLQNLKKTFEQTDYEIPAAFLERIGARLSLQDETQSDFAEIPEWIFSQLTNHEKGSLASALRNEKNIYCLEINFDSSKFADGFAAFRQTLCEKCEIIATLPAPPKKDEARAKIGFQILIATGDDIKETIEENRAEVVFRVAADENSNLLQSLFAQAIAGGETCAKNLGKEIRFEIDAEDVGDELSPELLKTIFDALNHLIRNAVDHAIETPEARRAQNKSARGSVKISFARARNGFRLRVSDDGCGIDAPQIKAAAIDKKLISGGDDLTEKETLSLVFMPELSTRATATEISGRGVGLDAVKTAVEKAGGTITVESEREKATTFEIFLPRENFR